MDRGLWRELGAAGFFALRLPEEEGGVGLGLPEAVLVFEEAGRALLPGPLVATHLAAGAGAGGRGGGGGGDGRGRGRPAGGGPGRRGRGAGGGRCGVLAGRGWRCSGRGGGVRGGGRPVGRWIPLTPLHRVDAGAGAGDARRAGASEAYPGALRREGALLTAAEQLGSAARTTEMAVQHARDARAVRAPIGAFQAVKHLCAEMLVRAELARSARCTRPR